MITFRQIIMLASVLPAMLAPASAAPALAAPALAAGPEQIGTWLLNCAGNEPCQLRSQKRFFDKGGITGDLEVQALGQSLVPVIALRGLSSDLLIAASMAGKPEASIQFRNAPPEALDCAPGSAGYFCVPKDDAARRLATLLPNARSVTVQVSVSIPGMNKLPAQEKFLDLAGTSEALGRLRAAGPTKVPNPLTVPMQSITPQSAAGLMAMADKALKAAGYPDGIAGLQGKLARYLNK